MIVRVDDARVRRQLRRSTSPRACSASMTRETRLRLSCEHAGELGHAQVAVLGVGEPRQHLVGAERQAVLGAQAGVEPAGQLGVRGQQPEPRRLPVRREVLQAVRLRTWLIDGHDSSLRAETIVNVCVRKQSCYCCSRKQLLQEAFP